jgi:tetratricopeptide (TPR) repeat protein
MHRALIVSSKYDPATGYPDREAWRVSSKRLGLRLQQHGYAVEWLEPGAGLVRKLREALATEDPLSAVVMVFSGYVLLTESGDPALLLSDEQVIALRLEQLCSKASRTFGRVLLVLDGVRGSSTRIVHDANPEAAEVSAETLLARMAVRTIRGDNTGMLVRVAPWGNPDALPDSGLCEQLSQILENLDDSQALATPELELDLLDSDADDGSTVLCRHSKPAFVFLPSRRFASEPPKAPNAPAAPQLDDGVDPYTSRDAADDRDAWTPPPDASTPSGYDRVGRGQDDQPSKVDDDDATSTLSSEADARRQSDPEPVSPPTPRQAPPIPVMLSAPALPSIVAPAPPIAVLAPPLVTPPIPAMPAPPVVASPAPQLPRAQPLGTPPPLPSERASEPASHASEQAPTRASVEPRAPKELGTPPPLPSERGISVAPSAPPAPLPPGPAVAPTPPPALSPELPPVSPQPTPPPPIAATSPQAAPQPPSFVPPKDLGVPPPLPSERASAEPETATGSTSLHRQPPNVETVANDAATDSGAAAEFNAPATLPTTQAAHAVATAAPVAADAAADSSDPRPSQSPSRPGPPPRKRRDSGAPEAPVTPGAPSLAPPVVSPESWRPRAPSADAPRDEAALLERAQAYLSANQFDLALSHAQECLGSFPESAQALQIAGNVLVSRGDFPALAALYDDLIGRLPAVPAAQLCAAASRLWQAQLHDPVRARELLERGLQLDVTNPSLQRELADLLDASGAPEAALAHSLAALRTNPFSPAAAQSTFQRLIATDATELKFTVACLLSFLGHPSNRVVDLIATHRGATLPRPTRSLNEEDYRFGLDITDTDAELTRVLGMLEPYARQIETPKPKLQRQLLDSLRAEDVERSTTMLARTFGWTCQLLTLGSPSLFLSEADSLPQLLPVEGANFVVGKSLGRGLSVSELAFLWGRTLSWSRPQTRILYTLPTTIKLSQFLSAARVAAGLEEASGAETKALSKTLRKEISGQTWDVLRPALSALGTNVEERVEQWKRAADRTANRIGLLASGDPELAARTLDRFPTTDGGSRKLQLSELLSFALSEPYQELRQRLGLHLG